MKYTIAKLQAQDAQKKCLVPCAEKAWFIARHTPLHFRQLLFLVELYNIYLFIQLIYTRGGQSNDSRLIPNRPPVF